MKPALVLAAAAALLAGRASAAESPEGEWLVQDGEARVRIHACPAQASNLCGEIVWLRAPKDETGAPKHDIHNPDANLRARPIMGLQLIRDFRPAAPGLWTGGKIYDPKSGKTYDSKMRIETRDALRVEGCVLMFCRAQTWRRTG